MIFVDALNMPGPAQGLQAAHMGANKGAGVLALLLEAIADAIKMLARPINAILLRHNGDIPV